MPKHSFTEDDLYRATRLRAMGRSWADLAERFGCDTETIRRQIDPEYRRVRSSRYRPEHSPFHIQTRHGVSPEEAARRIAEVPADTRPMSARLLGDPLPGRSALDKQKIALVDRAVEKGLSLDAAKVVSSMEDHLVTGRVVQ